MTTSRAESGGSVFGKTARRFTIVALVVWTAYLLVGAFPFVPLEGDEQGVIAGAIAMARREAAYLDTRYNFEIQPGSYVVLSALTRITGADVTILFGLLTLAGAVAFAVIGVRFVSRMLAVSWPLVAAAFLLCQEISAGGYYLNTTAFGGAFALGAVALALEPLTARRMLCAALLLAVAGWIRIDCVLISPALPAVVFARTRQFGQMWRETWPVAVGAVCAMIGIYFLAGVNPFDIVGIYAVRGAKEGWMRTIAMFPLVTSLFLTVSLLAGVTLAFANKRGPLLLVAAAGSALSFAVYGDSLASNKYLYLATPFFLLLAVYGLVELRTHALRWPRFARIAVGAAGVTLLSFDTVLGAITSEDRYRSFQPRPQVASLVAIPRASRPLQIVFGTGELITTADGFRLRTGALFAPLAWCIAKREMCDRLAFLAKILQRPADCTLFHSGWLPYQIAVRELRAVGFDFADHRRSPPFPYNGRWVKGSHFAQLDYLAYTDSEYFDAHRKPVTATGTATFFIGDRNSSHTITSLAAGHEWQIVPGWEFGYITLHQLR